ncbi:hypothetical protein PR202_gb00237 [Eleusine coracana subsp. coracana]|uniref:F-box domain-containing protein n=1 Tax=Eleusine coracana subsp. coracana TaxID=191504 RepID=A0AAV5DS38_ELECO|nr:hypothetical protein PR202_gb00237 [Eleusine coracana subsp. coracana]
MHDSNSRILPTTWQSRNEGQVPDTTHSTQGDQRNAAATTTTKITKEARNAYLESVVQRHRRSFHPLCGGRKAKVKTLCEMQESEMQPNHGVAGNKTPIGKRSRRTSRRRDGIEVQERSGARGGVVEPERANDDDSNGRKEKRNLVTFLGRNLGPSNLRPTNARMNGLGPQQQTQHSTLSLVCPSSIRFHFPRTLESRSLSPAMKPILPGPEARAPPALADHLLEEILDRIRDPADLARATAASKTFRRLVTDPNFLRRYRSIHPSILLGFIDRSSVRGFLPVDAPHPNAPAAHGFAGAAEFTYDYIPRSREWRWTPHDSRVLLMICEYNAGLVSPEFVVCDPLTRGYTATRCCLQYQTTYSPPSGPRFPTVNTSAFSMPSLTLWGATEKTRMHNSG